MSRDFFFLDDETYASVSWTYDDGFMKQGSHFSLFPLDDIRDDSAAWPADTAAPPQEEEDTVDTPLIEEETALPDPPPIELCTSFATETLARYYGATPPFAVMAALPGPSIREMRHPKDRIRQIPKPVIEGPAIPESVEASMLEAT
jgi:hypothetical protein